MIIDGPNLNVLETEHLKQDQDNTLSLCPTCASANEPN